MGTRYIVILHSIFWLESFKIIAQNSPNSNMAERLFSIKSDFVVPLLF